MGNVECEGSGRSWLLPSFISEQGIQPTQGAVMAKKQQQLQQLTWNRASVHTIPPPTPQRDKEGLVTYEPKPIVLQPGNNFVPVEDWEAAKVNDGVQKLTEVLGDGGKPLLQVGRTMAAQDSGGDPDHPETQNVPPGIGSTVGASPTGAAVAPDISQLHVKEAVDTIKNTFDRNTLKSWKKDSRSTVSDAAQAQLDTLEAQVAKK